MGNSTLNKFPSYPPSCTCIDDHEEEVNVYPDYYEKDPVITPEDLAAVRKSWRKIVDGTSENFQSVKEKPNCSHQDGSEWFGELFFANFFEVHPAAVFLFDSNIKRQIIMFTRKLSELLDTIERPNDVHMALMDLAVKHSKHGVHAVQYGIFGTALLNTLRFCLQDEYTDYVNRSWIKVYSFILSVVVPIALAEDRQILWSSIPRTQSVAGTSIHSNTTAQTLQTTLNSSSDDKDKDGNPLNMNHSADITKSPDRNSRKGRKSRR
eukprot:gene4033-8028_t